MCLHYGVNVCCVCVCGLVTPSGNRERNSTEDQHSFWIGLSSTQTHTQGKVYQKNVRTHMTICNAGEGGGLYILQRNLSHVFVISAYYLSITDIITEK